MRSRLGDLVSRIRRREYGNINSLLIARHGRLIAEEYFNGFEAARAHGGSMSAADRFCSAASSVPQRACSLDQFAQAHLFGPIGASSVSWFQGLPDGLPHGGGGLLLRPRDAAKIGQLMLDQGRWQGRQIVDPLWVQQSTARVVRSARVWAGRTYDYGFLWWLDASGDVVAASGARGQWIFIVPRLDLVMVSNGENDDGRWTSAVTFLYSHVLPAVAD